MKIAVDAYGGDHAPLEIIKGAVIASKKYGIEIVLVGNKAEIMKLLDEYEAASDKITVINADSVIEMEDDASAVIRAKKDSSMAVGLNLLAENEADAFVSAGNSGALLTGATLIAKRIKGIKRAAMAAIMPGTKKPYMFLDCGANTENKPEYLLQFGVMGSIYMQSTRGIKEPTVALLNNGSEDTKGTELHIEANKLLRESGLNFIGNIEARYAPEGIADVVVSDGFSGNIYIKAVEGMGKMIKGSLKSLFGGIMGHLAGTLVYFKIRALSKSMDYKEYGGAVLLGISKPVIKAHGSSDSKAIEIAIKQACEYYESKVIEKIEKSLSEKE